MRPITFLVAVLAVAPVSTAKAQGSPAKPVLIGLGAGAGLGVLLGGLADWAAEGGIFGGPDNPNDPCLERSCWIIGAAIGGGAGALLGAAKWARDDGANPILVAGAAGLAVGVSVGVGVGQPPVGQGVGVIVGVRVGVTVGVRVGVGGSGSKTETALPWMAGDG